MKHTKDRVDAAKMAVTATMIANVGKNKDVLARGPRGAHGRGRVAAAARGAGTGA